jgi:methyl acetate hydrolase
MQLVEEGKITLDAPAPAVGSALASPQVLTGFDAAGAPQLRRAKQAITLRHLLTHTAGFAYPLWDADALRYARAIDGLPARERALLPRSPLMFDPGTRWKYGSNIDWVGRIVEAVSGERLDVFSQPHSRPARHGGYGLRHFAIATCKASKPAPTQTGRITGA